MAENESPEVQEYEYQAEMQQLLHLIVNSLYTHPEVFLRELISNASDALNKARFRQLTDKEMHDADAALEIQVHLDAKEQTFEIEDSGIGMSREDLVERLGTVASSGTLDFVKQLGEQKQPADTNWIGKFGVGFYSVFMVADEVTVETRHADQDSVGLRWRSTGQGKYTVEEIDREKRGTKVSFKLKDEHNSFSRTYRVKEIVEKYSNFVDFPIVVDEEKVNTVSALWHRNRNDVSAEELEEFYKFVANDFEAPLGHLHLSVEGRASFRALLFIPARGPVEFVREELEKSVQLYSNRVFIQDDCKELLPEYLRFIRGVVDTEDLPLNVSREVTQSSPAMARIKEVLADKILGLLEDWAENDQEKYATFFSNFGVIFKTGVLPGVKGKDRVVELLRFESTKTEGNDRVSLKKYVEGMQEDQSEIYYVSGEHRDVVERNPNLEYFRKNDIEVLFLLDPVDPFLIPHLEKYDEKPLKTIEKADIDLKKDEAGREEALDEEAAKSLAGVFKEILGDRVEEVTESKRLVESAATLVVGETGLDSQTERMMKMMNKDFRGGKKILEINTAHPLIRNLSAIHQNKGDGEFLKKCVIQVFEGALLIDENLESVTDFVSRMTEIMAKATE